jgi:hypothetical protein
MIRIAIIADAFEAVAAMLPIVASQSKKACFPR